MKRVFFALISLLMLVFLLCSCGEKEDGSKTTPPPEEHTHIFSSSWIGDASGHWRAALCGCAERADFTSHTDTDDDELCDVCGESTPSSIPNVNLTSSEFNYKFIYAKNDNRTKYEIDKLIETINTATGVRLSVQDGTKAESDFEIIVGAVPERQESLTAFSLISDYSNDEISTYSMKFYEKKLVISVTDTTALKCALAKLGSFLKNGKLRVPESTDDFIIFNTKKYDNNSKLVTYEKSVLDSMATLSSVDVDGEPLKDFLSDVLSYETRYNILEGYPLVSAVAYIGGATVSLIQPSAQTGGVATIKVTSKDGLNTKEYTVGVIMQEELDFTSVIVNKDAKDGVITFVIDDGSTRTATYSMDFLAKYPDLTLSFALITNSLATLKISDDNSEYVKDLFGKFVYTQTPTQKTYTEFWQNLLSLYSNAEVVNHSYSHKYAGEDDTTLYVAYDPTGLRYVFPKGSISAQVYGSQQILSELLGQNPRGYILPGITGRENGWTTDSWKPFIKEAFLGARGTMSSTNAASMVMMPSDFKNSSLVYNGKAFMVANYYMATYLDENGNKKFYSKDTSYYDILAAGIGHATDFIDSALERGGWACFCFHDIVKQGESGTYHVYYEQADKLFGYANSKSEAGDAWVATYSDALTYFSEWAASTARAVLKNGEYIDLSLTPSVDNELYDMPLTVKVNVPNSWESCTYTYMGQTIDLTVNEDEDGAKFVYANIIPGDEMGKIAPKA